MRAVCGQPGTARGRCSEPGWELATALHSSAPWTDACAVWECAVRGGEASGKALLWKLRLRVMWNQREGAWRLLSKDTSPASPSVLLLEISRALLTAA